MPENIQIGLFALGSVLVLIGFAGGNFKLFGAEVAATISNRFLRFIAIVFGVVFLVVAWIGEIPPDTLVDEPTNSSSSQHFLRGTVANIVNGDIVCYVTIDTENGRFSDLGAEFDLCQQEWVGQKVSVSVRPARISDCKGAEPCGKTRDIFLITSMNAIN